MAARIGLTIVKRLVELHDGSAAVESAGAGARQRICVAAAACRARTGCKTETPARLAATPEPRGTFVVDDNRDAANTLAALLRRCTRRANCLLRI
jgi:signal transduction histidine kinase